MVGQGVEVRLGFGGKILGVRGGVSNKGFGVGVGPFSAGSAWKSGKARRPSTKGAPKSGARRPTQKDSPSLLWGVAALAGFVINRAERHLKEVELQGKVAEAQQQENAPAPFGRLRGWIVFGVCSIVVVAAIAGLVAFVSRPPSTGCTNEASPGSVLVPNVVGTKADEARDRLEDAGFLVEVKPSADSFYSSVWDESNWTVERTDPSACEEVTNSYSVLVSVDK